MTEDEQERAYALFDCLEHASAALGAAPAVSDFLWACGQALGDYAEQFSDEVTASYAATLHQAGRACAMYEAASEFLPGASATRAAELANYIATRWAVDGVPASLDEQLVDLAGLLAVRCEDVPVEQRTACAQAMAKAWGA